ncbi:MAG: N-formylglutamate deformylase [Gammaproteobacteria bacterium]|nr:N-formylglutamate deformylase [Gammaproteobacteria bacterium]
MPDLFECRSGNSPLLLSSPHDGADFPAKLIEQLNPIALINQDRDWFVTELYRFADKMDVSFIRANYSRYVVDLNRSPEGELLYPGRMETGLCPLTTFNGEALYAENCEPDESEIKSRINRYWLPYHLKIEEELERIKSIHGYALLWDAHSIRAEVPQLFDGVLPDLNFGTADGKACKPDIVNSLLSLVKQYSDYKFVLNGRFKGGYITRHYGNPENNVHAIQLEINQSTYLGDKLLPELDKRKSDKLSALLEQLFGLLA